MQQKKDINDITHVDVSGFASKTNLAALKTEVDKIDNDKLKTVPADLAKLSNVVKNDVVKKNTNTLENKIDDVEKKKRDVSGLATKSSLTAYLQVTTFNSKVTEVENKIKANDTLAKNVSTRITSIETNLNGFNRLCKKSRCYYRYYYNKI